MIVATIVGLLAGLAIPAFIKIRREAQDRSVLNNARQLAAAANQYFMENGVTTVPVADLIGSSRYVKEFQSVAGETYPANLEQGTVLSVTNIAGSRTITYSF